MYCDYHPWRRERPLPMVRRQSRPAGWASASEARTILFALGEGRISIAARVTWKEDGVYMSDPIEIPTPAPLGRGDVLFASFRAGVILRPGYYKTSRLDGAGPWRRVAAAIIPPLWRLVAATVAGIELPSIGAVYAAAAPYSTISNAWSSLQAAEAEQERCISELQPDLPRIWMAELAEAEKAENS